MRSPPATDRGRHAGGEGALDQTLRLRDAALIPQGSVLIFEQDEVAIGNPTRVARRASCSSINDSKPSASESSIKPLISLVSRNGLHTEVSAGQARPRGRRVALIEDQVEDMQGAGETGREFALDPAPHRECVVHGSSLLPGRSAGRWSPAASDRRERSPPSSARRLPARSGRCGHQAEWPDGSR